MAAAKLEKQIVATAVIFVMTLFGVTASSIPLFGIGLPTCVTDVKPFTKPEVFFYSPTHYEVHYVARMWNFDPPEVTVPAGSTIDIYLSTADITHGFQLLGTNVNLMAVPGAVNYARVKLERPGDYHVLCHEYCGTGHQNMATVIRVTDPLAPRAVPVAPEQPDQRVGHLGYQVLQNKACLACHTIDGKPSTGPTLKGLFGDMVELADGSKVKADEAYIRESIQNPQAKLVKGFTPTMPQLPISETELAQVIEYLKIL